MCKHLIVLFMLALLISCTEHLHDNCNVPSKVIEVYSDNAVNCYITECKDGNIILHSSICTPV